MAKSLALCLVLMLFSIMANGAVAATGRSCNSKESCRNKIMQNTTCVVSDPSGNVRLRSLPNAKAQAVGDISNGGEAYISDEQGQWVFIQGSETYEGHTEKTDGGWIPRSFLTNCKPFGLTN